LSFTNPDWNIFLQRETEFNLTGIKEYSFGQRNGIIDAREKKLFESLMQTKTSVNEGVAPASGKFPLVIYHPGLGGTIEESALLCEYLASNGFVVISCAYQPNHKNHLYPDWDLERSKNDKDFLIEFIKDSSFIDSNKIVLAGFSFGAQSNFYYETQSSRKITAIVSLDSRLEYGYDYHPPGYGNLTKIMFNNNMTMTAPMLCFSNPAATWLIIDSLKNCEKEYVMVPNYKHYDFTSQIEICRLLKNKSGASVDESIDNWRAYEQICEIICAFIKCKTSENKATCLTYETFLKTFDSPNQNLILEKFSLGNPEKLNTDDSVRSLRQLRTFLEYKNSGLLDNPSNFETWNMAIFSEEQLNELGYFFLNSGRIKIAIDLFIRITELYPNSYNAYDSLGEAYMNAGNTEDAIANYQKSLALNPQNDNAIGMIQRIKNEK
jgi:hypothetical protein